MYRIPTAWQVSQGLPVTLPHVTAVTRALGRHMTYGRAVVMLTANRVDSDTAGLAFTGPSVVSTRSVCRAIRAVRRVAAI